MKKQKLRLRESAVGLAFISPWVIGFITLTLYPVIYTVYLSFNEVILSATDGIKTQFIGLENFRRAITQDEFLYNQVSEYVSQMIVLVPLIIVLSLVIALLINGKFRGVGFFRTVFFLPVIITSGPVINNFISQGVATVDFSISLSSLFDTLPKVLLDAISYLTENFIIILWFSGVQILVYLSGLKKIDGYVYEAAKIDGAGKWETFWKITLPLINAMVVVNVVYTVVTQSLFALNPIVIKINEEMNNVQTGYGYSASLAVIYTLLIMVTLAIFVTVFYSKKGRAKNGKRSKL